MKKLLFFLVCGLLWFSSLRAQQTQYMVFEFIKVENDQIFDYIEFKDFMEKVYRQALNDDQINGWDFWALQSGADHSDFQYIMITYFDDPVKMMNGLEDKKMIEYTKIAYPHLSEPQVLKLFENALSMRDMPMRLYMREIVSTEDNFQMKPGVLASFDLMKAVEGKFNQYEQAEMEVFKPIHQNKIEKGLMGHWSFLRTALPQGSQAKSTHLTMNMYKDYMQFFNAQAYEDLEQTAEQRKAVNEGLNSRDQKWVYLATLENVVR
ncbi:MAG TPA: hypothetical protein DEQ87_20060 [Algoriphagus sp.]|uniref:hypothetical protein n=1 Tax=Algoriphagus TaxID=246875 RepID=UPI000C495588|nr:MULTISPECIES: hypothetical protein [Algoriphagus]MAL14510.1 hypothetical protein [Algoriphagus sp.]QYH38162.1 hypothetical protein GYM62_04880 [Algoriphagus sp. NBT04N3]HAD52805.1 hypothetical protein [Algoriphagus sp.]HAH38010.1 hypothetical protein [Algoriphagus sp.]HAZ23852.1 hypothetical protein [Algoriphagus sp.]